MKGDKGSMNIEFSERYDQESDVYYVSFKSGEPSYVEEVDDILLLEIGVFTNIPTGFRILNFKKHHVTAVGILTRKRKIRQAVEEAARDLKSNIQVRERQVEETLQKVLSH